MPDFFHHPPVPMREVREAIRRLTVTQDERLQLGKLYNRLGLIEAQPLRALLFAFLFLPLAFFVRPFTHRLFRGALAPQVDTYAGSLFLACAFCVLFGAVCLMPFYLRRRSRIIAKLKEDIARHPQLRQRLALLSTFDPGLPERLEPLIGPFR